MSVVYGSVGQPKASKPEVPGSSPGSTCFSLVFIKNLINQCYYLYCIVLGPSQLFITCISLWLLGGSICIGYLYYIQYIYMRFQ